MIAESVYNVKTMCDVPEGNAKSVMDNMIEEVLMNGKRIDSIKEYYSISAEQYAKESSEAYYYSSMELKDFKMLYNNADMKNVSILVSVVPCGDSGGAIRSVQVTVDGNYVLLADSTGWNTSFVEGLSLVAAMYFLTEVCMDDSVEIVASNSRISPVPYEIGYAELESSSQKEAISKIDRIFKITDRNDEATLFFKKQSDNGTKYGRIDIRREGESFFFCIER